MIGIKPGERAAVLLSGGLDSTVAMYWAARRMDVVLAVTVDYGQRHSIEIARAARIAEGAGVPHEIVHARGLFAGGLSEPGAAAADAVVPFRNLAALSIAAARGERVGFDCIVAGFCKDDAADFPDCRPRFIGAAAEALSASSGRQIRIRAPLIGQSKAMTVKLASDMPDCWEALGHTWTCYAPDVYSMPFGEPAPCGRCASCVLRREAFEAAGMSDPAVKV